MRSYSNETVSTGVWLMLSISCSSWVMITVNTLHTATRDVLMPGVGPGPAARFYVLCFKDLSPKRQYFTLKRAKVGTESPDDEVPQICCTDCVAPR